MNRLLNRRPSTDPTGDGDDQRPAIAIGHIPLTGDDVEALARFYLSLGMREVAQMPGVAILELRGGTHIAISQGPAGTTTLDLMVDDVDATRDDLVGRGIEASKIRRSGPHRVFTIADPEGNRVVINSSHVAGPV